MTTPVSTKKKPKKPTKSFPLYAHGSGQWAKKINGRLWYFGPWNDHRSALNRYLDWKDEILAGRDPRQNRHLDDRLTDPATVLLADMLNAFLDRQEQRRNEKDISPGEFRDLRDSAKLMVEFFGRRTTVASLSPRDFTELKESFAGRYAPNTTSNHIRRMKTPFRWAYEMELIDQIPNYGPDFKRVQKRKVRRAEQQRRAEHGKRFFEADEIRKILEGCTGWMHASVLLGINGGFGNADCGKIEARHVNFETGIYDLPRGKTGIERMLWLWPETREAIKAAMRTRAVPANRGDDQLCFLTSHGKPVWWETTEAKRDNIGMAFNKVLKRLELSKPGRSFYSLRRTYETVAGNSRDQVIVDLAMGHEGPSMAALYRQGVDEQRLIDVSQHVRDWLFPNK